MSLILFSILIPTIDGREDLFDRLYSSLIRQVGDRQDIEILFLKDNKEMAVGTKRQHLLDRAIGKYFTMPDDDDTLPDYYIEEVMNAIKQDPDCIGYIESVVIDGKQLWANHSNKYDAWADRQDGFDYVRTIFCKDVVRTSIGKEIGFTDLRFAEDHDFAKRLKASGLLKKEVHIPKTMYFYTFNSMPLKEHNDRYGISNDDILFITHNAGFFSCSSRALVQIMIHYNEHCGMPKKVSREEQYDWYKQKRFDNLITYYFDEKPDHIPYDHWRGITYDQIDFQYCNYKTLQFEDMKPFVDKFFTPGKFVLEKVGHYEWKYQLDYENTCAIFYRGNDKAREASRIPYEEFISRALIIQAENPAMKFLVQPDETEFLEYCQLHLGADNIICFEETPHMRSTMSCVPLEQPKDGRAEYGLCFFAAVLCISKCKHLVTHSGNGGFWSVVYRGNAENVHQYYNNAWVAPSDDKKALFTKHNAGFFSCCSLRLYDIMTFFNQNKGLPAAVDSAEQFAPYKADAAKDITSLFFKTTDELIPYERDARLANSLPDAQHSHYVKEEFDDTLPFVRKYFTLSDRVLDVIKMYEEKYGIDYQNLCAVHYRGNDRRRVCPTATYDDYIAKARQIEAEHPGIRFFILSDETEFIETFVQHFPNNFRLDETGHMRQQDSNYSFELPQADREIFAVNFLAALKVASKCKALVTHTGNCSIFEMLFRGNNDNVHQFYIDKWI